MSVKKIIYISLFWANTLTYSATITVQVRAYPDVHFVKNLTKPDKLASHTLNRIGKNTHNAGIFGTYAGFLEASNPHGYIVFPRKHTNPSLKLLLTNRITPIIMFEQTIQHWQLIPNEDAQLYTIEKTTDPDTQLTYWNVTKAELPEDNVIPMETLIIVAQPQHIYVPTGITITDDGPNLILPPIYTRKDINAVDNSLYMLNMAHLFGQVHVTHEKKDLYYRQQPKES